jgi:hypothetical protein
LRLFYPAPGNAPPTGARRKRSSHHDGEAQEKLNPAVLRTQIEAYKPYLYTDATKDLPIGVMSPKNWELAVQVQSQAGVLPAGLKPTDFYANSLVDGARIQKMGRSYRVLHHSMSGKRCSLKRCSFLKERTKELLCVLAPSGCSRSVLNG